MTYKLACMNLGMKDDFEIEGKTKDEVIRKMMKHAKDVHHMTDAQLKDPRMKKIMKEKTMKS